MKTRAVTALYVLLLACIVYLAGHQRHHVLFNFIRAVPGGDKLGHFLLMGLLSFLVNTSLRCRTVGVRGRRLLLGSLLVAAVVAAEEFSQLFIRYRRFDLLDLLCDFLGVWLFGRAALRLRARRTRRRTARGLTARPTFTRRAGL